MIQLGFYGAAGTVTGSKYLIDVNGSTVLVDCGIFQGPRELRRLNWGDPPFDAVSLEAVILTHAHIDHIGYLPRIVSFGFAGKVYCTPPTADIAEISLLDAANIQMEDAEYRNKKKLTRYEQAEPLFTDVDVAQAVKQFLPVSFGTWMRVNESIRFRYHVIGHILGAAAVEVQIQDGDKKVSILFSGDVGRYGNPLTIDPAEPPTCDYLVCESTYGGRMHPPEDPHTTFAALISEVIAHRGVLLIPAFAVGRTQQIVYLVNDLIEHGWISPIDIHIDSPMAVSATDIYRKYGNLHRLETGNQDGYKTLDSKNVIIHRKRKASKLLNTLKGPAIIISASGMLTGGRILHHLLNRLDDPATTVAMVGYQAEGTLGRKLLEGEKAVYIHKTLVPVNAKIVTISSLSAHADYHELLHWLEPVQRAPKQVFVTHGEPLQAAAMAEHLQKERNWNCLIPSLGQVVELV